MTTKHTKGPWTLTLVQEWPFGIKVTAANGDVVLAQSAVCHSSEQRTRRDNELGVGFAPNHKDPQFQRAAAIAAIETQDANARLIAAAPDMLEALEDIKKCADTQSDPLWRAIAMVAEKAIAKAKGE